VSAVKYNITNFVIPTSAPRAAAAVNRPALRPSGAGVAPARRRWTRRAPDRTLHFLEHSIAAASRLSATPSSTWLRVSATTAAILRCNVSPRGVRRMVFVRRSLSAQRRM
jgi:hypothetical protein